MKKVRIIIIYLGNFPKTFQLFLDSCAFNPTIDWLIVTDDAEEGKFNYPANVKTVITTFKEVKERFNSALGFEVNMVAPYKLCDLKPTYGKVYRDYLDGYDNWGYGDLDVVYGDLRKFLTDEKLDKYDKIYPQGHLTILKTNDACIDAFTLDAENTSHYKDCFTAPNNWGFDEVRGINDKIVDNGMLLYNDVQFIDRSISFDRRFRNVTILDCKLFVADRLMKKAQRYPNHNSQAFVFEDGHVYQYYKKFGALKKKEFCYLHHRHKEINDNGDGKIYLFGAKSIERTSEIQSKHLKFKIKSLIGEKLDIVKAKIKVRKRNRKKKKQNGGEK